jgi:hypothetical protein
VISTRGRAMLPAHGRQQIFASCLAVATGLHADPAVLVHVCVVLTFVAAALADRRAQIDLAPQDIQIGLELPGQHALGGVADVGTVEIESNAASQALDHLFGETRIRTGPAADGAQSAQSNTLGERVGFGDWRER